MSLIPEHPQLTEQSNAQCEAFFADPNYIHYVGMLIPARPGVSDTFQMLEFTHYKPNTPRNDLFQLRFVEWEGILWGVVSIPIAEKAFMEHIAQVNHVRIADGVPTMIDRGGLTQFPFSNSRVFTLENTHDHPIYQS